MTLNAKTAVDRFFEVLETANPLTDPARPADLPSARRDVSRRGGVRGHVAFRNVTFRYDDAARRRARPASTWSCAPGTPWPWSD